jgi:hypothetical protein
VLSVIAGTIFLTQLALAGGASVAVAVHWPDGEPAAGSSLEIECRGKRGRETLDRVVVVPPDGRYEFHAVPPGSCELRARWPQGEGPVIDLGDLCTRPSWASKQLEVEPGARLRVVLPPISRIKVEGTVRDPAGHVVSDATIRKSWIDLDASNAVHSGRDGHFVLYLPPEQREIWARANGFLWTRTAVAGPTDSLTVGLERGVSVRGRIVGADGAPVGVFTVFASRQEDTKGPAGGVVRDGHAPFESPCFATGPSEHLSVEQGAHGDFVIQIPENERGRFRFSAGSPDGRHGVSSAIDVSGKQDGQVVIKIGNPIVRGRLVDSSDGRALPGIRVRAAHGSDATTDREGAFSVTGFGLSEPVEIQYFDSRERFLGQAHIDVPDGVMAIDAGQLRVEQKASAHRAVPH